MAHNRIISADIGEELKSSYLDYAMSVIIGRALPDIRDGLKPVQRRILYSMYEMGNTYNKPYRKSARVVGEVIGKYHPHGDAPVYDAIVRMAQDFSLRYPLIDGHGNFGSIDGDSPAAMRYTEVRMARIASEALEDIEKETVEFIPNYDGSLQEPVLLPSRIPNLLMNGASGIAVGMATNIPPHNLSELVDALILLVDKPDAKDEEIFRIIKGPDFPTGGIIVGAKAIREAYRTGRGTITIRGKAKVERLRGEREAIIITEVPYQVNKAKMIEKIAQLVKDEKIPGISDIRDESDRDGIRVVLELKKGTEPRVILNRLYTYSHLQVTYGMILLGVLNNQPRLMSLKEMLLAFIDFRKEVVYKRTKYELRKAEERAHILEGLKIAVDNLDKVISIIRGSSSPEEARKALMRNFELTEIQAQAILDMRLQRLTKLERKKIIEEYKEILNLIKRLKKILSDEKERLRIIKDELSEVKEKYGDVRRTEIVEEMEDFSIEDIIQEEDVVITITKEGYIKRTPLSLYRSQSRGGKGKIGMTPYENDIVMDVVVASTHNQILLFSDRGKVYGMKVHEIPEGGRATRGKPLVVLLPLQDEKITACMALKDPEKGYLIIVTRNGVVKRCKTSLFKNVRRSGIIAVTLDVDDELKKVLHTSGNERIMIWTHNGMALTVDEKHLRPMGRNARGVKGISLRKNDHVIGASVLSERDTVLSITEKGYGKRTKGSEFRSQGRGGKGLIGAKVSEKTGKVVDAIPVSENEEVVITTNKGKIIRIRVKDIPVQGRGTQGVRLVSLSNGEKVSGVAKVTEE